MRKAFNKEVLRSITHSWGRFLAIAIIAALGTGFYAGLRMTGPDMRLAGDEYLDGGNISDLRIVSTLGLTDDMVGQLEDVEGVLGVMPAYEADVIADIDGEQYTTRVHSLDVDAAKASTCDDGYTVQSADEDYINRPILMEGSWPESSDECLLPIDTVWKTDVRLGDSVTLTEGTQELGDTFSTKEYTVVGFVRSAYYACTTSAGSTTLGNGTLSTYMYVPESSFAQDYPYTEAFVTVVGARDVQWPSDEYQQLVDDVAGRINNISDDMAASRLDGLVADAQSELDDAREEYETQKADALAQLDDAQAQLDDAQTQLSDAAAQLSSAQATIASSESQLASGQSEYNAGVAELAQQKASATAQMDAAQADLDSAQAQYDEAMATRASLADNLTQAQNGLAQVEAGINQAQAGIAALQAQIAALDPAAEDYETQKAALEAQLATAQATLAGLQQQQASLQGTVSQLQGAIAQIDAQTAGVADQIAAGREQLSQQRAQAEAGFAAAQQKLDAAAAQLSSGRSQLESGKAELATGQQEYADGLQEYQDGAAELAENREKAENEFADAEAELADAQAEIDDLAATESAVYVLDRTKNVGAEGFRSDSGRVDQIAQVFPLFFFLVAALVSLTTMTRMVDEERVLIGTYKALGYSNARITSKYLVYAAVASGVGSIVGIVALSTFLPWFIMVAYSVMYMVPPKPTPIDPGMVALAMGVGVGITVAATWFAAAATLRERPAALMLPRAPKAGKRILLERIRPLWRRMSFSWKVTARNIFRYKRRFFMAIVGIAGCTGLLLVGLGLQDGINDIIDKQYGELYHYSAIVRLDEEATDDEKAAVRDRVNAESEGHAAWLSTQNKFVVAASDGDPLDAGQVSGEQRVELGVPEDPQGFGDFNTLRTRVGHSPLTLSDDGVLVSEKLATALGVSVGDEVDIYGEDDISNVTGEGYRVKVAGIMENYVSQYVYMTPQLYEETFGEQPTYATLYAGVGDGEGVRSALSEDLLAMDGVKTVTYNDETIDSYRTMLKSVDAVVVVLVVAAALLAFVVLYNLTNINITERAREIATLKVLGFTPHEVNAYIYRETLLLAFIGAIAGCFLGLAMEGFVVVTAEVDQVMFGREIHAASFAIAFVLTMVFSVIVTVFMRRKLDGIDMVESLKSVE